MKKDFFVYKTTDVFNQDTLPMEYRVRHSIQKGEIENPVVLLGNLKYVQYAGETIDEEKQIEPGNFEFLVGENIDYRYEMNDEQLFVQFNYFTDATEYFTKKYNLEPTNPQVINAIREHQLNVKNILDLGGSHISDSLYLSLMGYPTTWMGNSFEESERLQKIAHDEVFDDLTIKSNESKEIDIEDSYDFVISIDTLLHMNINSFKESIQHLQNQTIDNGYHLISLTNHQEINEDILKELYNQWDIINLKETDDNTITLLAKK